MKKNVSFTVNLSPGLKTDMWSNSGPHMASTCDLMEVSSSQQLSAQLWPSFGSYSDASGTDSSNQEPVGLRHLSRENLENLNLSWAQKSSCIVEN